MLAEIMPFAALTIMPVSRHFALPFLFNIMTERRDCRFADQISANRAAIFYFALGIVGRLKHCDSFIGSVRCFIKYCSAGAVFIMRPCVALPISLGSVRYHRQYFSVGNITANGAGICFCAGRVMCGFMSYNTLIGSMRFKPDLFTADTAAFPMRNFIIFISTAGNMTVCRHRFVICLAAFAAEVTYNAVRRAIAVPNYLVVLLRVIVFVMIMRFYLNERIMLNVGYRQNNGSFKIFFVDSIFYPLLSALRVIPINMRFLKTNVPFPCSNIIVFVYKPQFRDVIGAFIKPDFRLSGRMKSVIFFPCYNDNTLIANFFKRGVKGYVLRNDNIAYIITEITVRLISCPIVKNVCV